MQKFFDIPGCLTDEDFMIYVEHLNLAADEIHAYREADRVDANNMLAYEYPTVKPVHSIAGQHWIASHGISFAEQFEVDFLVRYLR